MRKKLGKFSEKNNQMMVVFFCGLYNKKGYVINMLVVV